MASDGFDFLANYSILICLLCFNVGLSFIGASMARKKGYSFGGFWCLGFFSSFLVGIIAAWVLPDLYLLMTRDEYYRDKALAQWNGANGRKCVNCGAPLGSGAGFCSQCGAKAE